MLRALASGLGGKGGIAEQCSRLDVAHDTLLLSTGYFLLATVRVVQMQQGGVGADLEGNYLSAPGECDVT